MMMLDAEIKGTVRDFILNELLPGQDARELTDDLSLIDSAILDSMAALRMFAFLEEEFDVEVGPEDIAVEHMNTISSIAHFVSRKLKAASLSAPADPEPAYHERP